MDPDAVGMVSGVGRGMGVLDGGRDRRREGAVLGMNWGRPNGDFATRLVSKTWAVLDLYHFRYTVRY